MIMLPIKRVDELYIHFKSEILVAKAVFNAYTEIDAGFENSNSVCSLVPLGLLRML